MHSLTVADLRGSRLHLFWIQLLFTIVAAGALIAEVLHLLLSVDGPWLRSPLGSTGYLATGLIFAPMILMEQVWRIPRVVLLWSVPIFALATYGDVGFPVLWGLMSVASAAVSLWWFVRARRSVPTGPSVRPPGPGTLAGSLAHLDSRRAWLWIVGGAALGVALFVGLHFAIGAFSQYEANSEQATVTIVGIDEESGEALVVIDGGQVPVVDPLRNRPGIGDKVVVWVDSSDLEYVDIVTDVEDFQFVVSMLVGLAAATPLFGVARGLPTVVAARRRRSLVRHGAPARRVRVAGGRGGLELLPMDGEWPRLRLADMAGLVPAKAAQPFLEKYDEDEEPDEDYDDDPDNEVEPEEDEDPEEDWELPDDATLAQWADDMKEDFPDVFGDPDEDVFSDVEEDDKPMAEAIFGPELRGRESMVLLGPRRLDTTVALIRDSGQAWLAEIKEPNFSTGAWPALRRGGANAGGLLNDRTMLGLNEELAAWGARNFGWLRWVVLIGFAIPSAWFIPRFVRFALEETDGWVWLFVGLAASASLLVPFLVTVWGLMKSGRSRHGLIMYGFFQDEVVAPDRFVSVVTGRLALALRLRDPDDYEIVFPELVGRNLTPEWAALGVRGWFGEAREGSTSGRRLGPGPIVVALMFVAWGVQLLPFLF